MKFAFIILVVGLILSSCSDDFWCRQSDGETVAVIKTFTHRPQPSIAAVGESCEILKKSAGEEPK